MLLVFYGGEGRRHTAVPLPISITFFSYNGCQKRLGDAVFKTFRPYLNGASKARDIGIGMEWLRLPRLSCG